MKIKSLLIALCVMFSTSVFAQDFGHINLQLLVELMPERDSVMIKLSKYQQSLEETLVAMQNEYQTKVTEYQQKSSTWTAVVLKSKEQEIQSIEQRIYEFRNNASQELQNMQNMLFNPVLQKAQATINNLGKEKGLIYIFDISSGVIPYVDQARSLDLMPLAKQALNIPADKVAPTQLQPQQ